MDNSILLNVKKMLGVDADYYVFDTDLIIHINTVLLILNQIGIGAENFQITGENEEWSDFIGDDVKNELVRTYVYLKVRTLFDPPTGGLSNAIDNSIAELEWRLSANTYTDE